MWKGGFKHGDGKYFRAGAAKKSEWGPKNATWVNDVMQEDDGADKQ